MVEIPPKSVEQPKAKKQTGPEFDRFWEAYPRKEAKAAAQKAFLRLTPSPELLLTILGTIERQKVKGCLEPRAAADGRCVIPHASTWLNQRRWEDVPPDVPPVKAHETNQPPNRNAFAEATRRRLQEVGIGLG